ncbi:MAG: endonuclease/exonuclease/phosphatase family protein [Pseudomonadota bacterium]
MAQTWRIVTYNTWKCGGLYRDRLNWMGQGLRTLAPDILCLQEAFDCPERDADTARYLATMLGMEVEVLQARQKPREFEQDRRMSRSNLAVLSKRPMRRGEDIKLPEHAEDSDRWAMQATVSAGSGRRLRVVNTHLTHLRGEAGSLLRKSQAEIVARLCESEATQTVILCGDFNDAWDSASLSPLRTFNWLDAEDETPGGTYIGAYAIARPQARRIDHIQINASASTDVKLERRFPALNQPIGPDRAYPSDHAALVVDLKFNAARSEGM